MLRRLLGGGEPRPQTFRQLLRKMKFEGVEPDAKTFQLMLSRFTLEGDDAMARRRVWCLSLSLSLSSLSLSSFSLSLSLSSLSLSLCGIGVGSFLPRASFPCRDGGWRPVCAPLAA